MTKKALEKRNAKPKGKADGRRTSVEEVFDHSGQTKFNTDKAEAEDQYIAAQVRRQTEKRNNYRVQDTIDITVDASKVDEDVHEAVKKGTMSSRRGRTSTGQADGLGANAAVIVKSGLRHPRTGEDMGRDTVARVQNAMDAMNEARDGDDNDDSGFFNFDLFAFEEFAFANMWKHFARVKMICRSQMHAEKQGLYMNPIAINQFYR